MNDDRLGSGAWSDHEIDANAFRDKRLGKRLRQLVTQLSGTIGARDTASVCLTDASFHSIENGVEVSELRALRSDLPPRSPSRRIDTRFTRRKCPEHVGKAR